jgi:hypothetical protein
MSYQNVGKPRIYLNLSEYAALANGLSIDNTFRTLPVEMSEVPVDAPNISSIGVTLNNGYIAILGYNGDAELQHGNTVFSGDMIAGDMSTVGYMIADTPNRITRITDSSAGKITAGSVLIGTYYNFPVSPDLSLSLSYDYEGIKETTTLGGSTLTNIRYNTPRKWGTLGAWEFTGGNPNVARSGRRVWDISFSYISDNNIFPTNLALTNNDGDTSTENSTSNTLLEDDTFQRVIHLTNGGQIPFIFQPDSADNQVFAIAKFSQQSFKFDQVANNIYSVSLKIREVW